LDTSRNQDAFTEPDKEQHNLKMLVMLSFVDCTRLLLLHGMYVSHLYIMVLDNSVLTFCSDNRLIDISENSGLELCASTTYASSYVSSIDKYVVVSQVTSKFVRFTILDATKGISIFISRSKLFNQNNLEFESVATHEWSHPDEDVITMGGSLDDILILLIPGKKRLIGLENKIVTKLPGER
jgi:hypothetical protein